MAASADAVRIRTVEVLTPYLGGVLAESSARMYVERLGAAPSIGPREVEQLVGWIGPGLKVFVGPQRATLVLVELKAALDALVRT